MTRARDLSRLSNSNAFSVDATNRVGIGSTVPRADLDVAGRVLIGNDISIQSGIITATNFSGNIIGVAATFTGNVSIAGTLTYEDVTNVDSIGLITARSGVVLTGGNVTLGTGVTVSGATSNTFTLSTGGSERLRVDSSGNINVDSGGVYYDATNNRVGVGSSDTSLGQLQLSGANGVTLAVKNTTGTAGGTEFCQITLNNTSGSSANFESAKIKAISTNGGSNLAHLTFENSGTERLRITSAGLVGIGTTSPGYLLDVASSVAQVGNSTDAFIQYKSTAGNWHVGANSSNAYVFYSGTYGSGTERARIDSSGRLLVGTSSTPGGAVALLQVQGYAGATTGVGLLELKRGAAVPANGDDLGRIDFSSSASERGASITATRDGGTWTTGSSYPGRLVFSTTADGAASPTERMRITNGGYFKASNTGVYTDSAGVSRVASSQHFFRNDANTLNVQATSMSTGAAVEGFTSDFVTGATGKHFIGAVNLVRTFIVDANGNVTNTNNSYGAISDVKLKENIIDANSQWDDLKALRVCNYNFKTGESTHTQIGLIAQEVELVSPGLVSESPDLDADGNDLGTVTKSVNYSVLYMKAVKALQEAMERIETLEASNADLLARVSALESA